MGRDPGARGAGGLGLGRRHHGQRREAAVPALGRAAGPGAWSAGPGCGSPSAGGASSRGGEP
eukprot:11197633-Lingulodinium_polyedra.AAC.1